MPKYLNLAKLMFAAGFLFFGASFFGILWTVNPTVFFIISGLIFLTMFVLLARSNLKLLIGLKTGEHKDR